MGEPAEIRFCDYFAEWVNTYKKGAVRPITLQKYDATLRNLTRLAPELKMCELNKRSYQGIINIYAQTHERQTVVDFHTHLKAVALTAMDEGVIALNPCRNVVIKGCESRQSKKIKTLSTKEFAKLLQSLDTRNEIEVLLYVIAKTGARFSEALGLTPSDFDFERKTVSISKTLNYKKTLGGHVFMPTKNKSSVRKIKIDEKTCSLLNEYVNSKDADKPIFAQDGKEIYNSTYNNVLFRACKKAGVPIISIHGLRHTHASVLFANGVSVLSVSKRLGHSDVTTTQETYLHIIKELEDKDTEKIIDCMSVM
jgi:integrase